MLQIPSPDELASRAKILGLKLPRDAIAREMQAQTLGFSRKKLESPRFHQKFPKINWENLRIQSSEVFQDQPSSIGREACACPGHPLGPDDTFGPELGCHTWLDDDVAEDGKGAGAVVGSARAEGPKGAMEQLPPMPKSVWFGELNEYLIPTGASPERVVSSRVGMALCSRAGPA
eukprot:CAMPEP_0206431492 /NCGR_PEP_ID=MMETSP0324_2-20121206/7398_1 /ASSEMBLY_ACC=CAM_ASM_000836 /TAXON_ID=2866 /ORGANISM="Crypthecodinium cohnii, Strain Seligo" /LENGTH=174 /DNA_ID=CAMNT_0053897433 /DNA_START=461 /DNA_END=986 /DNA_ORIENTATION=-